MLIEGKKDKSGKNIFWLLFFLLLLLVQGFLLFLDHRPMFFLGDSASYIETAVSEWLPPDRSFAYGYFIRLVAVTSESLTILVVVQVLLACVASLVMAHLLIRHFRVRPWMAFAAGLLWSVEPLQLLYARYVMTETLALFVFSFYLWISLRYLEDPRIWRLLGIQCLATVLISLRFAFIPLTWVCAPLLPVFALWAKPPRGGMKVVGRTAIHVVFSILLLFSLTSAYKNYHGYLQGRTPAFSYEDGVFALSCVLPIVAPDDFIDKAFGEQLLNQTRFRTTDRRMRPIQHWMDEGVVSLLKKMEPDPIKANTIAGQAAMHAVTHKPAAFLKLGWQSLTDYFDRNYFRFNMKICLGDRRLDDRFYETLRTHFHFSWDQSSALECKTLTGKYFLSSEHWIQLLLFLPLAWLILIMAARHADLRSTYLFCGLISSVFMGVALFLSEQPVPRYLHGTAWMFFPMLAAAMNRFLEKDPS